MQKKLLFDKQTQAENAKPKLQFTDGYYIKSIKQGT